MKTLRTKHPALWGVSRVIMFVGIFLLIAWVYLAQPSFQSSPPIEYHVDLPRMQQTVRALSEDFHPRSVHNIPNMQRAAYYIAEAFAEAGGKISFQEYEAWSKPFRNVRATFGSNEGPRIILGAHYDSHEHTPGADDNASGVAGLIELAYLFGAHPPNLSIELVAYSTEEPPFFASNMMGSAIHAKSLTKPEEVAGVIVLEMIGYFTDEAWSQDAPSMLIKLLYPKRGNFISVVGNMEQRAFTKRIKIGMKGATPLPVYSVNAPRSIPGVDFSDHRNYWDLNLPAVMITDTAFYRNNNYHEDQDTWDTLDYHRMGQVVLGVYSAVKHLSSN